MDKFTIVIPGIVFIVALTVFVALTLVRAIQKRSREDEKIINKARELGFSFTERDDDLPVIKQLSDPVSEAIFINPPRLPVKQTKFAYNIMHGSRRNLDVWIFDWTYTIGITGGRFVVPKNDAMTVVVLQDKNKTANPFAYYEPGRLVETDELENYLDEAIVSYKSLSVP
jgi:hypothetical protein